MECRKASDGAVDMAFLPICGGGCSAGRMEQANKMCLWRYQQVVSRIMLATIVPPKFPLLALTCLLLLILSAPPFISNAFSAQLKLAWDPSVPRPSGYKVYCGQSSRKYDLIVDAGSATTYQVDGLQENCTYYFAVTAYDSLGSESAYSEELVVQITAKSVDSDGDGVTDGDETSVYGFDPFNPDSDGDGLDDGTELVFWGSHWSDDSDLDGTINVLDTEPFSNDMRSIAIGDWNGDGLGDLIFTTPDGQIYYSTEPGAWHLLPGTLAQVASADLGGGGGIGVVGVAPNGRVYRTGDLASWSLLPGSLKQIAACDLNGDGADDLVGVTGSGELYLTYDFYHWQGISGALNQVSCNDLNGDGAADLVGTTESGEIYCSYDLWNWQQLPGKLAQAVAGDLDGDGKADIVGVTTEGDIYYTLNWYEWRQIPGSLKQLAVGDLNGDGRKDLVGFTTDGSLFCSEDLSTWRQVLVAP